jgi:hypothetical protein
MKVLSIKAVVSPVGWSTADAYLAKDQLANVGYATPDAALQTITWLMMSGDYDQLKSVLSPELAAGESDTPEARASFERNRQKLATLFKGMQIVAQKTLSDGRVELKVKHDYDPAIAQLSNAHLPQYKLQPMVKVGNEWKLGGSTRDYSAGWDESGQIENFSQ